MGKDNSSLEGCIKMGPWGGPNGSKFSYSIKGGITKIVIVHGGAIDSILFKSTDEDGSTEDYSPKFGGNGGNRTDKIDIDWPKEYLTNISGSFEKFLPSEPPIIRSLCFHTNLTKYGTFGCTNSKTGTSFSVPIEGGVVVGFHGLHGKYLDAIGVYIQPTTSSLSHFVSCKKYPKLEKEAIDGAVVVMPCGPGPWGGHGGKQFDDGVVAAIKKVHVYVGDGVVKALRFLYEKKDGSSIWSARHGSGVEDVILINRINLDDPNEHLVGISGYFGLIDGRDEFEAIRSLTLYSNKGKYGPFGNETGHYFASPTGRKVVGFHGKSSIYLDAIGLHAEYF